MMRCARTAALSTVKEPTESNEFVVTFPARRHPRTRSAGRQRVRISVEWGYEVHSVEVKGTDWAAVLRGDVIYVESAGWYEGSRFQIRWFFNYGRRGSLDVSYGDDGADGFIGSVADAQVERVREQSALRRYS